LKNGHYNFLYSVNEVDTIERLAQSVNVVYTLPHEKTQNYPDGAIAARGL